MLLQPRGYSMPRLTNGSSWWFPSFPPLVANPFGVCSLCRRALVGPHYVRGGTLMAPAGCSGGAVGGGWGSGRVFASYPAARGQFWPSLTAFPASATV